MFSIAKKFMKDDKTDTEKRTVMKNLENHSKLKGCLNPLQERDKTYYLFDD